MNSQEAKALVASLQADLALVADWVAEGDRAPKGAAQALARCEAALQDSPELRSYPEGQHFARGLVTSCNSLGRHEDAVRIARFFVEVHETYFELFTNAADSAAALGRFDEAADLLGVALRKDLYQRFESTSGQLRTFLSRWPQSREAIDKSRDEAWFRILLGEKPPRPRLRDETCRIEELWADERLALPDHVRPVLFRFTREEALGMLESPPLNPLEYWFSADYDDRSKFPFPEAGARLLQLVEVLVGCGHAEWLAGELPRCAPRVAVVAAMSGHASLVPAAERVLEAPGLGGALDLLRPSRTKPDDHRKVAAFGFSHSRFLSALADAIRTYSLTMDHLDSLLDPAELFAGFDRANPGKLVYFFIQSPESYPLFSEYLQHWGRAAPKHWGNFVHPRGHMLYTKAYHYRAAALACCFDDSASGPIMLRRILERLDGQVSYIQSGRTLGFRNDTRRAVATTLEKLGKLELRDEVEELLEPVEDG